MISDSSNDFPFFPPPEKEPETEEEKKHAIKLAQIDKFYRNLKKRVKRKIKERKMADAKIEKGLENMKLPYHGMSSSKVYGMFDKNFERLR